MSNASSSVSNLLHRLGGVYRDPPRVTRDTSTLLRSPPGLHLRPSISGLVENDGSSTPAVLLLSGTIGMTYKGATYNIPIDLYLPPGYPVRPPVVFVRPVASMMIKEGHKNVGSDGMVYMPYLHDWRPHSHSLTELVVFMSSIFGDDPPVFARPALPAYDTLHAHQQQAARLAKEAAEANAAVEATRRFDLEQQHANDMRDKLTLKLRTALSHKYAATQKDMIESQKEQRMLSHTATYLDTQVATLQARRDEFTTLADTLSEQVRNLDQTVTRLERESNATTREKLVSVDEMAIPHDVHSAQMLVLCAENAALSDCLYFLDKGLESSRLTLDVYLKTIRKLAKRQFLVRAHLLKISQVIASAKLQPLRTTN